MKKILICVILFALCGCSKSNEPQTSSNQDAYCEDTSGCGFGKAADMSGYENVDEKDNMFEESDMQHFLNAIKEKKTGVFYLGFEKCPWCVEAIPVLQDVAKQQNQKVAYVKTRDEKGELLYTPQQKKAVISYASDFLNQDDKGEYQIYVPFVVIVKDGNVIMGHVGTIEGHDAHERIMNDEEKQQLHTLYKEMFQKLK